MLETFCGFIDRVNGWVGKVMSLVFIPLVIIVVIEVVSRYFLNRPTRWAWDVNSMLAASLIALGGGYTLAYRAHVIVDIIANRFSKRTRAIVDAATSAVFFFSIGALSWLAVKEAILSVGSGERYSSLLEPPLAPIRIAVAIGILLLLVQGIANFLRDLLVATGAKKEGT